MNCPESHNLMQSPLGDIDRETGGERIHDHNVNFQKKPSLMADQLQNERIPRHKIGLHPPKY